MKTTLIPLSPLLQNLDMDERNALWQAWKIDQAREKLVKDKMFKGESKEEKKFKKDGWFKQCLTKCFPPHKDFPLSEIHDDALKLQTKIAKAHKKKARSPLENSIQNKVRRTFPSLSVSWFC